MTMNQSYREKQVLPAANNRNMRKDHNYFFLGSLKDQYSNCRIIHRQSRETESS